MITFFDIGVSEMVDGQWQTVRKTGMAKILDRGFQMQLGTTGYCLEVISSTHYEPGEIIYAYAHSCEQTL